MAFDRVALVTGANQGVGFQVAKELLASGVSVLVGSRNLERGEEAVTRLGTGAVPVQLDVTDEASIGAAAERIRSEFGRLDLLINNAAISHTNMGGQTLADYGETSKASTIPLDEVRAIWETNVFGVLAVYQAMLPLLRESSDARIVNVSSGVGSLASAMDPANSYRPMFNPGYSSSKTALNAITVAMMIELEGTGIKVNLVSPGFTSTNLNNFAGAQSVEDGSREVVRVALLGPDGSVRDLHAMGEPDHPLVTGGAPVGGCSATNARRPGAHTMRDVHRDGGRKRGRSSTRRVVRLPAEELGIPSRLRRMLRHASGRRRSLDAAQPHDPGWDGPAPLRARHHRRCQDTGFDLLHRGARLLPAGRVRRR
jgi:NAD(P)-dependent dehydrogenase (short-subunit alcohol dehydrogenase family)